MKQKPGTWIERELFESKAFLSLTGFAPQLLVLVFGRRQFKSHKLKKNRTKRECLNKNNINISYVEYKETYNITQPRLTRAIDQLLEKGFIYIINPGGGYKQDKAVYGLSDQWCLWQEGVVFKKRTKKDHGFCRKAK